MDSGAEMVERHGRLLARFAEQAASLADDLHASALAAETIEDKQALALAFQRTGRALRQTLMLEAKLRRDAKREDRFEQDRADQAAAAKLEARKSRVRAGVEDLIWSEAADDDQVAFLTLLNERLDVEDLADPDETLETTIHRLAKGIGLPLPSPLAGEGVARRVTDEGSHHPLHSAHGVAENSERLLIRPADAGHLLPQGEKGSFAPTDSPAERDYWNSA